MVLHNFRTDGIDDDLAVTSERADHNALVRKRSRFYEKAISAAPRDSIVAILGPDPEVPPSMPTANSVVINTNPSTSQNTGYDGIQSTVLFDLRRIGIDDNLFDDSGVFNVQEALRRITDDPDLLQLLQKDIGAVFVHNALDSLTHEQQIILLNVLSQRLAIKGSIYVVNDSEKLRKQGIGGYKILKEVSEIGSSDNRTLSVLASGPVTKVGRSIGNAMNLMGLNGMEEYASDRSLETITIPVPEENITRTNFTSRITVPNSKHKFIPGNLAHLIAKMTRPDSRMQLRRKPKKNKKRRNKR